VSNRAAIEPTEFVNPRTKHKTYGVRVYDDYAQAYDNTWESIPADEMAILRKVVTSEDEVICQMMQDIWENEKGIYVDGNWHDWSEIAPIFDEETDEEEENTA
jgi:hypothetical protein